jgi:hypothetical protein
MGYIGILKNRSNQALTWVLEISEFKVRIKLALPLTAFVVFYL